MKTILFLSILFCAIALPTTGELTVQDLDKIRSLIKESEQVLKEEIGGSEKRTKEYIDLKINSVEKQITLLTNFVYAPIALIVVAIGIPQILIAWQNIKRKSNDEQLVQPIKR